MNRIPAPVWPKSHSGVARPLLDVDPDVADLRVHRVEVEVELAGEVEEVVALHADVDTLSAIH